MYLYCAEGKSLTRLRRTNLCISLVVCCVSVRVGQFFSGRGVCDFVSGCVFVEVRVSDRGM